MGPFEASGRYIYSFYGMRLGFFVSCKLSYTFLPNLHTPFGRFGSDELVNDVALLIDFFFSSVFFS